MPRTVCGVLAVLLIVSCTSEDKRFVSRGNLGAVQDMETGLEWIAGPDDPINWHQAKEWVESLGGGWRMPNGFELNSLCKKGPGKNYGNVDNNIITPLLVTTGSRVWADNNRPYLFDFSNCRGSFRLATSYPCCTRQRAFAVRRSRSRK